MLSLYKLKDYVKNARKFYYILKAKATVMQVLISVFVFPSIISKSRL